MKSIEFPARQQRRRRPPEAPSHFRFRLTRPRVAPKREVPTSRNSWSVGTSGVLNEDYRACWPAVEDTRKGVGSRSTYREWRVARPARSERAAADGSRCSVSGDGRVVEVEIVEAGVAAVGGEVDGAALGRRRSRTRRGAARRAAARASGAGTSTARARSGSSPPGSASSSLRLMRSLPSTLVRVTPSGSSTNAAAQRATSAAIPRSGSGSASARSSSASTIASTGLRLVAAALADGALALGVGPAGAVGDHVAVVARRAGGRRSRAARRAGRGWGRSGRRGGRGRARGWCASASALALALLVARARGRRRRRRAGRASSRPAPAK